MRALKTCAVLMATAGLGLGATPSAGAAADPEPGRAAGFTPPIGTNHGSVVDRPLGFEMDLYWTVR